VCPEEDSALVQRIRPMQQVQPTPGLGETDSWHKAAKALEIDDRDIGWHGPVAIERSDGPRPPLTGPAGPRALLGGGPGLLGATGSGGASSSSNAALPLPAALPPVGDSGATPGDASCAAGAAWGASVAWRGTACEASKLEGARQHLRTALRAIEACDSHVRDHASDHRRRSSEAQLQRAAALQEAALEEARTEAAQLRRDLLRLRGDPQELAALPTGALHQLQQELSAALRSVHGELEARAKCCVCREVERQVLLRPCQHLALCRACARRVDRCPLCRTTVESFDAVCVA